MTVRTSTIDIPTADGVADAILAVPTEGGPYPGVLLYMDAFGLRPRLEEMASRLAREEHAVLVPNVFYRGGRAPVVDLGDLTDPQSRVGMSEKLGPLMQALTPELAIRDADAYLAFLAADDRVAEGPFGAVGYCMGGALALRTGAHAPTGSPRCPASTAAGSRPTSRTARTSWPAASGARSTSPTPTTTARSPPDQQQRLSEALGTAGVDHRTELYDGAGHGFTMADTAAYDEAATERHWGRLLELLARTIR